MSARNAIRLLILFFLLPVATSAQSSSALEASVKSAIGKLAYLRVSDESQSLHFDSTGTLIGKPSPCVWTVCSALMPTDVRLTGNSLIISGSRAVLIYDRDSNSLVPLQVSRKITITIDLPVATDSSPMLNAFAKIFDDGDMSSKLHDYWRPQETSNRDDAASSGCASGWLSGRPVYRSGCPEVKIPKAIATPAPEYSEIARKNGVSGVGSGLMLVVNEQGFPEVIEIKKKAAAGLDISSVDAISQWKFTPALRNGVPVPFVMEVQTSFMLSSGDHPGK